MLERISRIPKVLALTAMIFVFGMVGHALAGTETMPTVEKASSTTQLSAIASPQFSAGSITGAATTFSAAIAPMMSATTASLSAATVTGTTPQMMTVATMSMPAETLGAKRPITAATESGWIKTFADGESGWLNALTDGMATAASTSLPMAILFGAFMIGRSYRSLMRFTKRASLTLFERISEAPVFKRASNLAAQLRDKLDVRTTLTLAGA